MHLALRCECGAWLKWVRKSQARRYQADRVRLSAPKPAPTPIYKPVTEQVRANFDSPRGDDSHKSCAERFEKIERELTVLVRAILACGVIQGKGGTPERDVDDGDVDRLAVELAREEEAR
jgi:hypothetical protein